MIFSTHLNKSFKKFPKPLLPVATSWVYTTVILQLACLDDLFINLEFESHVMAPFYQCHYCTYIIFQSCKLFKSSNFMIFLAFILVLKIQLFIFDKFTVRGSTHFQEILANHNHWTGSRSIFLEIKPVFPGLWSMLNGTNFRCLWDL